MRKVRPRVPGNFLELTGPVKKGDRFEFPFSLSQGPACSVHDDILIRIIIFKCCVDVREVVQSVKCLPCKYKNTNLIPEPK